MQRLSQPPADLVSAEMPRPVLNADLALVCCLAAWGPAVQGAASASCRRWLAGDWRQRLDDATSGHEPRRPEHALSLLRRAHADQCHANPAEIHPSWWSRALQGESPAVQSLVARLGPPEVRAAVRQQSGDMIDTSGLRPPDAQAAEWVLSLWTERLVGGEAAQPDEPPAIVALAMLAPRELYALCHAAGQAKAVLAGDPEALVSGRARDRQRAEWFAARPMDRSGTEPAALRAWAARDLQMTRPAPGGGKRRRLAALGLNTLARLLSACEPYRVRWVLQHVPYAIAKRIRSTMAAAPRIGPSLRGQEQAVLESAWERLAGEGRIPVMPPPEPARPHHAP